MSHVGNGSDDFKDLDRLNLSADVLECTKQARIEARSIIDRLEPLHIDGWPSLIMTLEDCLENAKRCARIYHHMDDTLREYHLVT
ncbi:MAG: hypothetical protein V1901_02130 [Patescibacteria group bacterium]